MPNLFRYVLSAIAVVCCGLVAAAPVATLEYIDGEGREDAAPLIEDGILEDCVAFINEVFVLERDIAIIVGADDGPLYDPSDSEIQLPYHFYGEVLDRISKIESDPQLQIEFAHDAMLHTLYHEIGHALIDQFELPVVGKEEDAVDGLASMLLIEYYENGAAMAANAAELFALEGEARGDPDEQDFWGEHSLDEQRYYSTLCHIVGSDPQQYREIADDIGFSEERVEICSETYTRLVSDREALLDDVFNP